MALINELKNREHLLTYFRHNNAPVGVVLAVKDSKTNTIHFGWSKCGVNKHGIMKDKFTKERGQFIALKRAEKVGLKNVPTEMVDFVKNFVVECKAHYAPRPPKFEDAIIIKP